MARRIRLDRDQLVILRWFLCEITVMSLIGVALWLSLSPKYPRFTIHSTNASASASSATPTNSSIVLLVDLQIFNPNNHMGIDYSGISLKLCAGDAVFGVNSASAFHQGYRNTTLLQMQIQAMNGNASPHTEFVVRVETEFRFRIIKWNTKLHRVEHEQRFGKPPNVNLNETVSGGSHAPNVTTTN